MQRLTLPPPIREPDSRGAIPGAGLGPVSYINLGDGGDLTQSGAQLEVLPPGSRSGFRHWHAAEDEFLYLLSGSLILIESTGEVPMVAGAAASWPANSPNGHCLENRSPSDARYLVVGTRSRTDVIHYPDHDLVTRKDGPAQHYFHADGTKQTPNSGA